MGFRGLGFMDFKALEGLELTVYGPSVYGFRVSLGVYGLRVYGFRV